MTSPTPGSSPDPVRLRGGGVVLGGRPVLRDVDLTVHPGEFVALLGANGSGKSTLVRALTGLVELTRGDLELFGVPVDDFTERHRIGYVPQHSTLLGGVPSSVREVVTSGLVARRSPLTRLGREGRERVERALAAVDLLDKATDSTVHLSGGQRQRMLIARALVAQPDLLVLDEPTAGIDLPHQQALAETLATLRTRGTTILMVAHETGPIAPLVDRAVVLRDGRVVHDGAPLTQAEVHHHHDTPFVPGTLGVSPLDTLEEEL